MPVVRQRRAIRPPKASASPFPSVLPALLRQTALQNASKKETDSLKRPKKGEESLKPFNKAFKKPLKRCKQPLKKVLGLISV